MGGFLQRKRTDVRVGHQASLDDTLRSTQTTLRKHLSMSLHNTIGKRVNNVSKDCTRRKS